MTAAQQQGDVDLAVGRWTGDPVLFCAHPVVASARRRFERFQGWRRLVNARYPEFLANAAKRARERLAHPQAHGNVGNSEPTRVSVSFYGSARKPPQAG